MEKKVLAKVNGVEITETNIQNAISRFPKERQGYLLSDEGKQQLLNQLVTFELYYNYAKEIEIEKSEKFGKALEIIKRETLTQIAIDKVLSEVEISDKEAEDYYETNKNSFVTGETIEAKHILVDSEEKAKGIVEKIKKGMSFADAATEYSSCPSKAQGGNLGKFTKGQMVPEFEKVAFELEVGVLSEPVKTQFGYHLIEVESKEEAKTRSFDEVKDMIKSNLIQQKQNNKYMTFTEELKKKYSVEMK